MHRYHWGKASFVLALCLNATLATAAPLSYDESVNGDLPPLAADLTLSLDNGTNTVKGSGSLDVIANPFSNVFDVDSFSFTTPVGDVLTSITYSIGNKGFSGSLTSLLDGFKLDGGSQVNIDVRNDNGSLSLFVPQLPLGTGAHTMDNNGIGFGISGSPSETGMIWDYTWTFEVTKANAVPEPGSLLLFASGLAGLCILRRRKIH